MHHSPPRSHTLTAVVARRRRIRRARAVLIVLLVTGVALLGTTAVASAITGTTVGTNPVEVFSPVAAIGVDDGVIETGDSISPFDTHLPALARLDPALLAAVQSAARDAEADGVPFVVTSGWRSAAYQQSLFDEAVLEYGSVAEASRLVASAESSNHVTGTAIDIGYTDANSWLSQHGTDYGLCQKYANEMWHFELLTSPGGECPAQLSDASEE